MTQEHTGHRGFYEDLVAKVRDYKGRREDLVRLAPDLFKFMTSLLGDKRTPGEARPLISAAIAYFVVPRDVIPEEVFGALALVDDVFICLHVSKQLIDIVGRELLSDHWQGEKSLQEVVAEIYPRMDKYVGHAKEQILNYVGLVS